MAPPARSPPKVLMMFPIKLHKLLSEAEEDGYDDVISWLPGGKSFKIHKREKFVHEVLPLRFGPKAQYRTFQKNLNMWCFSTVSRGPFKGTCSHPFFRRDAAFLCHRMVRKSILDNFPARGDNKGDSANEQEDGSTAPTSTTTGKSPGASSKASSVTDLVKRKQGITSPDTKKGRRSLPGILSGQERALSVHQQSQSSTIRMMNENAERNSPASSRTARRIASQNDESSSGIQKNASTSNRGTEEREHQQNLLEEVTKEPWNHPRSQTIPYASGGRRNTALHPMSRSGQGCTDHRGAGIVLPSQDAPRYTTLEEEKHSASAALFPSNTADRITQTESRSESNTGVASSPFPPSNRNSIGLSHQRAGSEFLSSPRSRIVLPQLIPPRPGYLMREYSTTQGDERRLLQALTANTGTCSSQGRQQPTIEPNIANNLFFRWQYDVNNNYGLAINSATGASARASSTSGIIAAEYNYYNRDHQQGQRGTLLPNQMLSPSSLYPDFVHSQGGRLAGAEHDLQSRADFSDGPNTMEMHAGIISRGVDILTDQTLSSIARLNINNNNSIVSRGPRAGSNANATSRNIDTTNALLFRSPLLQQDATNDNLLMQERLHRDEIMELVSSSMAEWRRSQYYLEEQIRVHEELRQQHHQSPPPPPPPPQP